MKEQAIQYLIKSFDEGSYYMIHLKVEPILDPLRADPRFTDVMRRVGIKRADIVTPSPLLVAFAAAFPKTVSRFRC